MSNLKVSYQAARESAERGIVCVGIADTDAKVGHVSVAIPGNDESITSIYFYNNLISRFILQKKYL